MALGGIYIHIPFCRQACLYCNFHFSTSLRLKNDLIRALLKEIALTHVYDEGETIETVYFGGGTPSLLTAEELKFIMEALHQKFTIRADAEITLEANPDDVSAVRLAEWKNTGINRLSMGVQSFFEEDLKWMNRAHNARQAIDSIALAQDAGFNNLTIDLIFGLPGLSDEKWQQNVQKAINFNISHLSCYALTVEPKTTLHNMISKHKLPDMDAEQQARQFMQLMQWLTEAGYEHYEISNFALPGRKSRHNSSYWQGKPYYGFGPAAHSFNGRDIRSWNVANNAMYIRSIEQNLLPAEQEKLTLVQRLNEYLMTGLRTMEGIDMEYIQKQFGNAAVEEISVRAQQYVPEKMVFTHQRLRLTDRGKLFADGIAADLFRDEPTGY